MRRHALPIAGTMLVTWMALASLSGLLPGPQGTVVAASGAMGSPALQAGCQPYLGGAQPPRCGAGRTAAR